MSISTEKSFISNHLAFTESQNQTHQTLNTNQNLFYFSILKCTPPDMLSSLCLHPSYCCFTAKKHVKVVAVITILSRLLSKVAQHSLVCYTQGVSFGECVSCSLLVIFFLLALLNNYYALLSRYEHSYHSVDTICRANETITLFQFIQLINKKALISTNIMTGMLHERTSARFTACCLLARVCRTDHFKREYEWIVHLCDKIIILSIRSNVYSKIIHLCRTCNPRVSVIPYREILIIKNIYKNG